ncbi:MAG: DUF898 family protein [Bacteroidia bacterium]|nr:DUF898 family protein [Bacteroidia bacterium]
MNPLKFEGKGFDFFKILFVDVILAIVSLTLLYPRAIVRETRYFWSQTTLGNSPFEFVGTTKTAFNGYMKTLLAVLILMVIAFVEGLIIGYTKSEGSLITSFVKAITILSFAFLITPLLLHGDLNFYIKNTTWRSINASYHGKLSELTGLTLRGSILSVLTLGIYTAWYETQLYRYLMKNVLFGSLRFGYSGTSKDLFKMYLKGFFLGILTLGIYHIWNFRDLYNYTVDHTVVRKGDQEFSLHSNANTRDVFEMLIGNVLLVVLTLGFGSAWAFIRFYRFMINHCVVPAAFNLESIEDKELEEEPEKPSTHWLDQWNPMMIG